jgi:hypothetical protein
MRPTLMEATKTVTNFLKIQTKFLLDTEANISLTIPTDNKAKNSLNCQNLKMLLNLPANKNETAYGSLLEKINDVGSIELSNINIRLHDQLDNVVRLFHQVLDACIENENICLKGIEFRAALGFVQNVSLLSEDVNIAPRFIDRNRLQYIS